MATIPYAVGMTTTTPEEFAAAAKKNGGKTVLMIFPRAIILTTPNHTRVHFTPGTHEVPEEYKDHNYLKAAGARIKTAMPEESDKLTAAHIPLLQAFCNADSFTAAIQLFKRLTPESRKEFLAEAEKVLSKEPLKLTELHRLFLVGRGYKAETVEAAQKFFDNLTPAEQMGFLRDAETPVEINPESN